MIPRQSIVVWGIELLLVHLELVGALAKFREAGNLVSVATDGWKI